nr:hypothetical protein BaRGS_029890 [Batillaria attramentaria]
MPSEQAKLFCPSHGIPICHICATSKHRACPEVTELADKLAEARKVLGELVEMLSEGESKLEHAISQLDQHLIDVDMKTDAILVDIDTAFDRLRKSMESRRKQLKEMAVKAKSDAKTSVQDGKTVFVERRGKLTSQKQLVKRAGGVYNPTSADDVKTTLKARVEGLDRSAILPMESKIISIPSLTLEQEAIDRVVKELDELGQVKNVPALLPLQQRIFCFHTNHGQNIVLSNNQQTAERVRDDAHGIVLSNEPIAVNMLHSGCPELKELQGQTTETQKVLKELVAMLSEDESKLEQAIGQLDRHVIDVDKKTGAIMADIDAAFDRLQRAVETRRKQLKDMAMTANAEAKASVGDGKKNIVLSNNQQTAERVRDVDHGIVLTSEPMEVNLLYECLISRLQSYINTQCPICHTLVADPKDRATKSYAEIANALPTDVTMVNLVESARKLSKSHVCCACEQAQCKLFCPSHGVSICHICATSSHSACPEVTELEGQMAEARNVLKVLVEMLSEGESKLERAIGQLDKHLVDVDKKTEAILVDIDTAFDRLHKCMESRRKQLKEMAANANSEAKASAQDGKTVFTERRERLTSHKQLVKRAQGVSNPRFADDVKTSLMMRVEGLDRSAVLPNGSKKTFCFHENHGQNIVLSNRQRTAERVRDVDHGIVLSSEPMDENLLYEVDLPESVSVVFDNGTYRSFDTTYVSVCHSACPEVTELENQLAATRKVLKKLVEMLSEGENALERALGELDKHLTDVDEKTSAILLNIDTAFDRLHKSVESRRKQLKEMARAFCFHANHGKNIVLSNNGQTAERVRDLDYGIVLTREPMELNLLYEVVIEKNDPSSGYTMLAGVVTEDPASLTLPNCSSELPEPKSIVFWNDTSRGNKGLGTFPFTEWDFVRLKDVKDRTTKNFEKIADALPTDVTMVNLVDSARKLNKKMICAATKHHACPEMVRLEDKLAEVRKVLGQLVDMLSEGESRLEHAIRQLDKHLVDVDEKTKTILGDIDTAFDRLQTSMESRREQLKVLAMNASSNSNCNCNNSNSNSG